MNILRARLSDASWATALWIDDHDRTRATARWWHHRKHGAVPGVLPAAVVLPFTAHPAWALPAIALLVLIQAAAAHLADRTHAIGLEDAKRCPLCPHSNDNGNDGGGWEGPGPDDNPPAGPLDPFTVDDVAMFEALYRLENVQ